MLLYWLKCITSDFISESLDHSFNYSRAYVRALETPLSQREIHNGHYLAVWQSNLESQQKQI